MNSEGMEAKLEHIERMLIAQQDLINLLLLSVSQNNGSITAELTNNLIGIALSGRIKLTEEFTRDTVKPRPSGRGYKVRTA